MLLLLRVTRRLQAALMPLLLLLLRLLQPLLHHCFCGCCWQQRASRVKQHLCLFQPLLHLLTLPAWQRLR
jgi:hypothetical protein